MLPQTENINDMSPKHLSSCIKQVGRSVITLREKNEDLLATLYINKQLLDVMLDKRCEKMSPENSSNLKELMGKLHANEDKNSKLFHENISLYEKILDSAKSVETGQHDRKAETLDLETKNAELTAMWAEKERKILALQNMLKNMPQKKMMGIMIQEKHLLDPTQQTLVMHNELQVNKIAFKKLSKKMNDEIDRRSGLLVYNKQIKTKNEQLKAILKSIMANNGSLSEKAEGLFKSIDLERVKSVLENDIGEPAAIMDRAEEVKQIDATAKAPPKGAEPELSVASSMGLPLPAKNELSKSHDRIKPFIPMLDFSKIQGRADLSKADKANVSAIVGAIGGLEKKRYGIATIYGEQKKIVKPVVGLYMKK